MVIISDYTVSYNEEFIYILELEGCVAPGILKRFTMERHLYRAGFGIRQMQMYNDAHKSSSKRFCKPHRMMLLQGDYSDSLVIPMFYSLTKHWMTFIRNPQESPGVSTVYAKKVSCMRASRVSG